jgi:hypothetical protein
LVSMSHGGLKTVVIIRAKFGSESWYAGNLILQSKIKSLSDKIETVSIASENVEITSQRYECQNP